jgi:hypothetical protein
MRFSYFFVSICVALVSVTPPAIGQPIDLQSAESHIDKRGCLQFDATAMIHAQIDDLFEALTRPEELWQYAPGDVLLGVYVSIPVTNESLRENTWSIKSPSGKILEWDGSPGPAWGREGPPRFWVEYRFFRTNHTIFENDIGSTSPWGPTSAPHSDKRYVLASVEKGSATSVRFYSSQCWPPGSPKTSSEKLGAAKGEKQWLGNLLAVARDVAARIQKEHLSASAPSGLASYQPRAGSGSLPTPIASPAGGR